MRALVCREYGPAEKLVIEEHDDSVQFRQELALHSYGKMELTVRMRLLPMIVRLVIMEIIIIRRIPVGDVMNKIIRK